MRYTFLITSSDSIKKYNFFSKTRIYWFFVALTFVIALFLRLIIFDQIGGDWGTYKDAVIDFTTGVNPYIRTVASFATGSQDHGYAYFPTLLYIQTSIWYVSNLTGHGVPSYILWKIPVLLCDLGIAFILLIYTQRRGYYLLSLALFGFWLFNPYFLSRYEYSLYDPIFLFVLLVSLLLYSKYPKLCGFLLGLSVSLKTIPLILLPLLFLTLKSRTLKFSFFISFVAVFVLISLPFLKSFPDFWMMVQGSLLVHGERGIQGKPILTFISYFTQPVGLNFYQPEYFQIYAMLALLSAAAVPLYLYFKRNVKNIYLLSCISFLVYTLISPVLSRTHLLWFLPFLFMYLGTLPKELMNYRKVFALLTVIYLVMFAYLFSWGSGMQAGTGFGARPLLPKNTEPWELIRLGRQKFYEFRGYFSK